MLIGVPKEIKNHEYRVGLTPGSVHELCAHGHRVLVETGAGEGIGAADADYREAGAVMADSAEQLFAEAGLIVKVKEPQAVERQRLRPGQLLFTYLHLAPDPEQTRALLESGVTAIAYETVTAPDGSLPLLAPMSEVAGRLSIQAGAHCLEKAQGGKGVLLGGVPGVLPGKVAIIGGGTVGRHAAEMAIGLGADVTILDRSNPALKAIHRQFGDRVKTLYSTRESLQRAVLAADLVIGSVLIPGAAAPKLVTAAMVAQMAPGTVLVDVAIDQGGCFETSRPTTHDDPTFVVDGVLHYCVANMPGAVPRTSSFALNNATLPFVLKLAERGLDALREDPHLRRGLNVHNGRLTLREVAEAQGLEAITPEQALGL